MLQFREFLLRLEVGDGTMARRRSVSEGCDEGEARERLVRDEVEARRRSVSESW